MRAVRNTEGGIRVLDVDAGPEGTAGGAAGGSERSGTRPGDVRVRVASSGICGSDLHLVGFGPSPVTLGHEFAGRTDDGSPVAVLPIRRCGHCEHCRSGHEQRCPEALSGMYGITVDGGMADEAWVDPSCALPLPAGLAPEDACLVEPLAVAVHGCHRAGVEAGARVLVVGGGPVGLCAVAAARGLGAAVDLVANRTARVEAGERLGARIGAGTDYDVVMEAAGTQGAMDRAIELVRPGGTVGLLGTFWAPVALGISLQMREVALVPAFTYGHHHGSSEFALAAELLAGSPDLAPTVLSHRFALDEAARAFDVAADWTGGAIKVVLVP